MITEQFSKKQIARLSGFENFPKAGEAIKELVMALMVSATEAIAINVIDEIISGALAGTKCPYPADIRRMAYDRNKEQENKPKCPICDGVGMVTIWRLVTYKGNSFSVDKIEALPSITTNEQARDFAEALASAQTEQRMARQQIVSAAKDCTCRATARARSAA